MRKKIVDISLQNGKTLRKHHRPLNQPHKLSQFHGTHRNRMPPKAYISQKSKFSEKPNQQNLISEISPRPTTNTCQTTYLSTKPYRYKASTDNVKPLQVPRYRQNPIKNNTSSFNTKRGLQIRQKPGCDWHQRCTWC